MSDCDAGHGCTAHCPGGCFAIYVRDSGECYSGCEPIMIELGDPGGRKTFDIDVNDMDLEALFRVLKNGEASSSKRDLKEKVTIKLENVTVDDVLEHLEA